MSVVSGAFGKRFLRFRSLVFLLVPLLLAGCSGRSGPNPLVTTYSIQAPAGSIVVVEFGTETNYGLQTSPVSAPTGGGIVNVLVAGMRPSTLYHMRARITNSDGSITLDPDRTFQTGTLDMSRFPKIKVSGDTGPNRGIELINIIRPPGVLPGPEVQAIATDLSGNVIWYYDHDPNEGFVFPIKLMRNGHMLVTISDYASISLMREVDLAGNTIREIGLADLNTELASAGFHLAVKYLHHDMLALPNGHFVLLAAEDQSLTGLAGQSGSTVVEGDAIIDLDPDLKPVWVWSAFDHLDVNRQPLGKLPDWTHGNALVYTSDHNLLLSLRNQHWILKIDYGDGAGSGDVVWRLGYEGDFALQNGDASEWFYGQHMPSIISVDGSRTKLAVFDDGNNRVTSAGICGAAIPCYSRAVIYEIDENARTAVKKWDYKPDLFTFWGGATQPLKTGNLEFALSAPEGLPGSRALEVSTDAVPRVVWQMDLSVPEAYRINRIPSLYPGVSW